MKTVVLKMICDAGWTDAAGKFIARAVLVDLNLDTGLVSQHFENDADAENACGPMPAQMLLFEPAGLDYASSLILRPAWDFAGRATGFHIACRSLNAHKPLLKLWASHQESLPLVSLLYRNSSTQVAERRAA